MKRVNLSDKESNQSRVRVGRLGFLSVISLFIMLQATGAQLIYDREKGIIFSSERDKKAPSEKKTPPPRDNAAHKATRNDSRTHGLTRGTPETIHADREKDGPGLYHQSGLRYFENSDFPNALKNFKQAHRLSPMPEYLLWIGKSHRRLGDTRGFLSAMTTIIEKYPDGETADDALFELAYYRQEQNDYHNASRLYARLAEQYPFGVSVSNGIEYLETTRERRRTMRAEMVTALKYLGYTGSNVEALLKSFQADNGFESTGNPDPATVTVVKKQYAAKFRLAGENARMKRHTQRALKWGIPLGILMIFNLGIVIAARINIGRRMKTAAELKDVLTDLDTTTI